MQTPTLTPNTSQIGNSGMEWSACPDVLSRSGRTKKGVAITVDSPWTSGTRGRFSSKSRNPWAARTRCAIWLTSISIASKFSWSAARKRDEMLEPYEWKRSRTVLRRESGSNPADLVDFGQLVKALGGEVLPISPHSSIHLNALDIDRAYGEGKNPLVDKVKLILSIFEPLTENGLTAKQRSLLDRCAERVYRGYIRGGYRGTPPTLVDLRRVLLEQPEAEAHDLALASELYTTGSLNIFAHQTNVNTDARILCYDIRELDEQLRPVGMVVTLDAIFNRVIRNWRQGKRTWILADEFYILFRYSFSAEFFYRLFKRMRKYNAFITAISQNVDEILRSDTARLMLANSELLVMLNQAATDREELAKLLNISENQLSYITNVPAGHGLIRCGGAIIPFENSFPKNTKLYQLMTTKPNEKFE